MKSLNSIGMLALLALAACTGSNGGNYPEGLPKALQTEPKDGEMPEYISEAATSKVTITFLGEVPEEGTEMNVTYMSTAEFIEFPPILLSGEPTTELEIPTLGTTVVRIATHDLANRYGEAWIKPGEETHIYLDNRPDSVRLDGRKIYADGFYSNLTAMAAKYPNRHSIGPFGMFDVGGYDMTGDEYINVVAKAYADSIAAVNADTVPELVKALNRACNKAALPAMLMTDYIIRGSWFAKHMDGKPIDPDSVKLTISPENIIALCNIDDLNDPSIQMVDYMPLSLGMESNTDFSAEGQNKGLIADIYAYRKAISKANAGVVNDDELAALEKLENGKFYVDAVKIAKAQYDKKFEQAKKSIRTLPEGTPADKIIETIAEPFKGKVVIIDLWNTWCGPCKAAIAANEPLKDNVLANDDLVFVYIADGSSPMADYIKQIANIKGDHYRLTSDLAHELHQKYGVDGIPFYILVDRQGNITARPDFRDHDLYIKTINEELAK